MGPTQPSPFINTILRPLHQFIQTHATIIISSTNNNDNKKQQSSWKQNVIHEVTLKYHIAIQDLIDTVKRTEVALKNRKSKKTMFSAYGGGGIAGSSNMTDGEKVRLQLLL